MRPGRAYLPSMSEYAFIARDRAVLAVSGPDAREFLQGIVTQDMDAVGADRAAYGALLTPQGKVLFDFLMAAEGAGEAERLLFDVDAKAAPALMKRLALYKLRSKVEIAEAPDLRVFLSSETPDAAPGAVVQRAEDRIAFVDPREPALGLRAIVRRDGSEAEEDFGPAEGAPGADDRARYNVASHAAHFDARRIALGVPAFGVDILSEKTFPLDANMDALAGVAYRKGCFVGQEVASRMKRKGDVRKRMLTVAYEGPDPDPGEEISDGETTLGEVRSARGGKAIAQVRLDRLASAVEAGRAPAIGDRPVVVAEPDYLVRYSASA